MLWFVVAPACVLAACGGGSRAKTIDVHVTGPSSGASSGDCFLTLRSQIEGGGTETYCLKRFNGEPGPNAVVRDSGRMTFALDGGDIAADVNVVMRFEGDGKHARQTLRGKIVGGSRDYDGARGTISGGGTATEDEPGHVAEQDLRYTLELAG
jgi:hypothetical protein